jgi:hypothetical protein
MECKDFVIKIIEAIEKSPDIYLKQDDQGRYYDEIYADYRDEMDYHTAIKILRNDNPLYAFEDKICEWYAGMDYHDNVYTSIINYIQDDANSYSEGLTEEQNDFLRDWLCDNVYHNLPYDHFLKQEFYTNIMIDTGDGNYDFTLNAHYPCYCGGRKGEAMDDKASLVWLAKQQGYTKGQLRKALDEGDASNPRGFLESCRVELANMTSHMQILTFLVRMDLKTLIKINRLLRLREKDGHQYDTTKYPDCGYIVLDKSTMCGLFDPWQGGGSVLEIRLEKDVKIPIKFIRSCLPDGGDGYGIDDVYGLVGSCWGDTLKEICVPQKIKELMRGDCYVY